MQSLNILEKESLENWDESWDLIMTLAGGHITSKLFNVLMKYSICDIINESPKHYKDIAIIINFNEFSCYRLLRYFVPFGLFKENDGVFSITDKSKRLILGGSVHSQCKKMSSIEYFKLFESIPDSLLQNKNLGPSSLGYSGFWDIFKDNQDFKLLFTEGMREYSNLSLPTILNKTDFSSFNSVVDVGGAHGWVVGKLVEKYQNLNGIIFDLDVVINSPINKIQHPRVQYVSGSFFESVPSADCYVLKFILHDWADEKCLEILKTISKSMKENSKIYIFDSIIDPANYKKEILFLDMCVFQFFNGKERTINQWRQLYDTAGFNIDSINYETKPELVILSKKNK
ncbi:hypothetical protein RB653_006454 [Dictyostelium firmibasis]|uniref:O-methyltransferase domain-containing protein n=1 Tax=Dictyostelium firmibasis TaxID=79012 RepID=A0AAN7U9Q2_9MYCE